MAIHRYMTKDGIYGYRAGDLLIEEDTGRAMVAVPTGAGTQIEHVQDVPFDEASDVTSIWLRLHPLDVGFDLREHGTAVVITEEHCERDGTIRVSYPDEDRERRVLRGSRLAVVSRLARLGFEVR